MAKEAEEEVEMEAVFWMIRFSLSGMMEAEAKDEDEGSGLDA